MQNSKGPPVRTRQPLRNTFQTSNVPTITTSRARVQVGIPPADFDAARFPILALHFFGDPSCEVEVADLQRRPMRADELIDVREIFWNCAAAGHRLPAEHKIIVFDGGKT